MNNLLTTINKIIPKIILGFIVVSLILTGMSNYLIDRDHKYVAKINNQKISFIQLEQAIKNIENEYKKYTKKQSSQLKFNKKYLQQQALYSLINEILLEQYANKLKISISDDQIKKTIITTPAFHVHNKFDNVKFHTLIDKVGLSSTQYAELIRKKLLIQKIIKIIIDSEFILPEEIKHLLETIFVTRTARFAIFNISELEKKQTVSHDEIQANYIIYKKKYLIPETFKVSYILIDLQKIQEKIKVNKKEVQNWYNKNSYKLILPEKKRYSIIKSQFKNCAHKWLKQLQHGIKLSEIATKIYSTDTVLVKKGNNISWINENKIINELKQANLTKKGQISDIIKSKNNFFIIQLDDIQPMQIQSIDKVYDKIVNIIKRKKATTKFFLLRKIANTAINNCKDVSLEIEKSINSKFQTTGWFFEKNIPKKINYKEVKLILFKEFIFNKNKKLKNNFKTIVLNDNSILIIRIDDYQPKRIQDLKEVYTQINKELKNKKAKKQALEDAKKMLFLLKNNTRNNFSQVTKINFSNPQYFDSTNKDNSIAQAVFALPKPKKGESSYGITIINKKGDIALISLDNIKPKILHEQQKKLFIKNMHQKITNITFNALLTNLYISAKIKTNI